MTTDQPSSPANHPTPVNDPTLPALFASTQPKPAERTLHPPVFQFVEELTSYDKQITDPETGYAMTLEQVTVDMPIELKVAVNPDGTVKLTGSPPTQLFETTIMPVFHHMRLRVVREDGE